MAIYTSFDYIFEGTEDEAMFIANTMDFSETEVSTQEIKYARYIGTSDDDIVEVYYDYGADYYFFVDLESSVDDDGQPTMYEEYQDIYGGDDAFEYGE